MSNLRANLGTKIRLFRKEKKWSLEVLAKISGINPTYLSQLERGNRNPTLDILEKLSNAFEIPLQEFFSLVEIDIEYFQIYEFLELLANEKQTQKYLDIFKSILLLSSSSNNQVENK